MSSRDRRAIRVGLLAATPALLYAFVVKPYAMTVRRLRDDVQQQCDLLAREEEALINLPVLRADSLPAATAAGRATARSYAASDTAMAMTAFDRDITAALEAAGLAIQRVEMRDSVARRAGLQELTIDIRAQGDFEAIIDALARLEKNARLIHISRLSIDKTMEGEPLSAESLSLAAIVHGYAK
jgi:type II secretory pathway component PulM